MAHWDGLNRRRFPRCNFPCLVVIKGKKGDKDVILSHTENIGLGGICVILKQSIDVFDTVDLELDLMDLGEHIKCEGKVVWNVRRDSSAKKKAKFYDIGVEFIILSDRQKKRIENVIENLLKNKEAFTHSF